MKWTHEQYEKYQAKRAWAKPRTQFQKQQDADARPADHRPEKAKVDGAMHGKFRVSITLLLSDKRDRDPDGAASTLMDCVMASIGRLGGVDRRTQRKLAKRAERQ